MVSARTAILLALRQGPAYGRELLARIARGASGRVRLSEGTLRPALRALRAEGLVAAWAVVPGRERGGRERRYCELTLAGVREAEAVGAALAAFARAGGVATGPRPAPGVVRYRAERVAEVSRAVSLLRDAISRRRRSA